MRRQDGGAQGGFRENRAGGWEHYVCVPFLERDRDEGVGFEVLVCAGKTAVHKAVAGRIEPGGGSSLTGEVTFNNSPLSSLKPRRLACFVGQTDQHFADLTVLETCKFAQDCNRLFDPQEYQPLQELHQMVRPLSAAVRTVLYCTVLFELQQYSAL